MAELRDEFWNQRLFPLLLNKASEILTTPSPMPLEGATTPSELESGRISSAINAATGFPDEPSVAQRPTVSSTIDPSLIDMNKFRGWYKGGVDNFGLHPDPYHPDMNINIHDLFARGGRFQATEPGKPDAIVTADGKTTPITPNNMPMVKTSEQLDKERQALPQAPPTPQLVGVAPQTVSATIAAPPPQVQMPEATPSPAQPPAPTVAPNDLSGKIMSVAGMIASAADPKRFGPAGEMLTKVGVSETAKARADAAAQSAGFSTAEQMAAMEQKAKLAYTQAQTKLMTEGQLPLAKASVAEKMAGIPKEQAQTQLVQAETALKQLQLDY